MKEPGLLEELLRKTTRLIAAWQRRCARKLGVQGRLLTGAVTQVQYWGSALQLSPHFHTLAPDGLFAATEAGVDFVPLPPPTPEEVATLVTQLARRVTKVLRQRVGATHHTSVYTSPLTSSRRDARCACQCSGFVLVTRSERSR